MKPTRFHFHPKITSPDVPGPLPKPTGVAAIAAKNERLAYDLVDPYVNVDLKETDDGIKVAIKPDSLARYGAKVERSNKRGCTDLVIMTPLATVRRNLGTSVHDKVSVVEWRARYLFADRTSSSSESKREFGIEKMRPALLCDMETTKEASLLLQDLKRLNKHEGLTIFQRNSSKKDALQKEAQKRNAAAESLDFLCNLVQQGITISPTSTDISADKAKQFQKILDGYLQENGGFKSEVQRSTI